MANVLFKKGLLANLPKEYAAGTFYVTTDERAMYLDIDDSTRIRLGDFIEVASIANLPTEGASTTALYYCAGENVLAKWNGSEWKQINPDTGVTSVEVVGEGNAVTAASYDAETRKLTLTKGETFALPADISNAVGDLGNDADGNAYATVKAYVDAKTTGIATDATVAGKVDKVEGHSLVADTEIAKLATVSEGANKVENVGDGKIKIDGTEVTVYAHPDKHSKSDLDDALVAEIDGKVKSVAAGDASITVAGTATEPTVAVKLSGAEGNALTLADDGLKVIIPESTKVEASETNGNIKVDGEEVVVYAHPEKHTVSEISDYATDVASKIEAYGYETAANVADKDAQVLVDAKAYVDNADKFEIDMLTVNAHGGVAAGTDLNGLTTHEILKKILYPYVEPTLGSATASPNGGTYEKGVTKTITSVSISVTKKSELITSVALYNGSTLIEEKTGDAVKNGGTITFSNVNVEVPTNGNQLTVKVTDAADKTYSKSTTAMTFVYPYYMGSCAAGTAINEDLVESLSKKIESKGNKSNSYTVSDGHMVFAYPKAHGVLKSILDPNNFETIGNYTRSEVSVTGLDGTAQAYYVYVSGATTVSGFTVNFKY